MVSFDAVSLYTSVNVERTVNHILDIIYQNPIRFFPESEKIIKTQNAEKTVILKPPEKKLLKTFFMDVLLKFSSFEALSGFYRQKSGLSMGSKISPSVANIFVSIMEKNLIKDLISQNIIISYYRYVERFSR